MIFIKDINILRNYDVNTYCSSEFECDMVWCTCDCCQYSKEYPRKKLYSIEEVKKYVANPYYPYLIIESVETRAEATLLVE